MNSLLLRALLVFVLGSQSAQTGIVSGSVLDANTGQIIRNAKITVEGLSGKEATTDLDGIFRMELPAGKYKLRFTAPEYNDAVIDGIEVVSGRPASAYAVMAGKSAGIAVDVVDQRSGKQI